MVLTEKIKKSDKKYHLDINYIHETVDFDGISLVQAGRMMCGEGTVIADHAHLDWFELTLVRDGEGEVITNGKSKRVKSGDIYISFPCDTHGIVSGSENPLQFDFFSFKTNKAPFSEELEKIMQGYAGADMRIIENERLIMLVESVIAELSSEEMALKKEFLSALLKIIVVEIIRSFKEQRKKTSGKSMADVFCYQIMNYIDTHIYSLENLSDLGGVFDYNYSYISSFFKKHTGQTLASYHKKRKIETAKLLVLEGKLTETQISELLNYSTLYAFIKAFKSYTGVSPGKFRKNEK